MSVNVGMDKCITECLDTYLQPLKSTAYDSFWFEKIRVCKILQMEKEGYPNIWNDWKFFIKKKTSCAEGYVSSCEQHCWLLWDGIGLAITSSYASELTEFVARNVSFLLLRVCVYVYVHVQRGEITRGKKSL